MFCYAMLKKYGELLVVLVFAVLHLIPEQDPYVLILHVISILWRTIGCYDW